MTSNRKAWEEALLLGSSSKKGEASSLPKNHVEVGLCNLVNSNKQLAALWKHGRLSDKGWSDAWITRLLWELSEMDTSGKSVVDGDGRWCGVGEREGRVYSSLVKMRHYGLSHGMGRSGDIQEAQPKAVGSTALVRLTNRLVLDVIQRGAGLTCVQHATVLPLCTGMTVSLVLKALCLHNSNDNNQKNENNHQKNENINQSNENNNKKCDIILWSRIDQKSCFKAIPLAGLTCVVIPTICNDDGFVQMDMEAFQSLLLDEYKDRVAGVLTTTSCFAPRITDPVDQVAKLCQQHDIPHIVNHAYGLQCHITNKLLNRASTIGRVDAIIMSTDKNFMVPVGGAIVVSSQTQHIQNIGKLYAGRASSTPIVDLFITLLSMGLHGYQQLLQQRLQLKEQFIQLFQNMAHKYNESLIVDTNNIKYKNTISFAITLNSFHDPQLLGSKLFLKCVSGTRVVTPGIQKDMNHSNIVLKGFGSSHHDYPHSYLTAACAIGLTQPEMQQFFKRLDKSLQQLQSKQTKHELQQLEHS